MLLQILAIKQVLLQDNFRELHTKGNLSYNLRLNILFIYSFSLFFYIKVSDYLILTQCKDTNNIENSQIYIHEIYENTQIHSNGIYENTQIWMFEL